MLHVPPHCQLYQSRHSGRIMCSDAMPTELQRRQRFSKIEFPSVV